MGKKQKQKQKEKKFNSDTDSEFDKQLRPHGFTIKTMLGDGNCLFRSLGDQLEGHSRNHMQIRLKVVDYIKEHRDDFEPFIEDDVTFDDHVSALVDNGTYGGNDSIVAFSRIHNSTVYIHQFNAPAFVVHGNEGGKPKGKDIHISYHNGDHYNSVVKVQSTSNTEVKVNNDENGANSTNKNTGGGNNRGVNNKNKSNVTSNRKQNNKTGNLNKKSPDEPHIESLKINEESKNNSDENSEKENASKENVTNTPAKPKALSRRQKLDLKKKERKQESMQRKRSTNTFDGSSSPFSSSSSASVSNSYAQHDNLFKVSTVKTLSI